MSAPQRDAPPGLHVPADEGMSGPAWWVFLAAFVSVLAGGLVWWWEKDVSIGAYVAGSCYFFSLLTIIALKD